MRQATVELSVLVVSYCTRELTIQCISSLLEQSRGIALEVIVVDNASDDGSAEAVEQAFPDVRVIRSGENLGFAAGNNLAAQEARGEWILLLNPDTITLPGAVSELLSLGRSRPDGGIFGGRTLTPEGAVDPRSCWRAMSVWSVFCRMYGLSAAFRGNRFFDPEFVRPPEKVEAVDVVTGCLLLIRRDLWMELDGFDPTFFMYGEEVDLCIRARRAGYQPLVTPSAAIVHYGGASERVHLDKQIRVIRARVMLMWKHWSSLEASTARLLMLASVGIRACVEYLAYSREGATPRFSWLAVWRRRQEWALRRFPSIKP